MIMPIGTSAPIFGKQLDTRSGLHNFSTLGWMPYHLPSTVMSYPSDTSRPGGRVTLPPIRDLFRDEFMQSLPGEPPSSTLARLRVDDDGSENSQIMSSRSPTSVIPSRPTHKMPGPESTSSPPSTPHRARVLSDAPRPHPPQVPSNHPFYPTQSFPHSGASLGHRPPNSPTYHPQSYHPPQSQPPHFPGNVPPSQGQYPSQSQPNLRGVMSQESSRLSQVSTSFDPASSAAQHNLEAPPALARATAPWVIATNLEVGQIYEDDERTTIARPFDGNSLARTTSHAIPLGRFLDDTSGAPLGKYDCKVCGKLFNRPSSLRIHLNSHTGEKPYICPFPNCGRSFSVLSNMRRHARVHTGGSKEQEAEEAIDESSEPTSPTASSSANPSVREATPTQGSSNSPQHYRQDSNTSTSSSRNRGRSSGTSRVGEPEK